MADDWAAWLRLSYEEMRQRIAAEFCEKCGAVEHQPCMTKNKTVLPNGYMHMARHQAARARLGSEVD